ncbi:hypothetical protein HMPREF1586_00834 [Gardnerella vaginalis JCP8522]|nr:hypothetical protein HMPREF1586_00834 [Gardnerella vaginalis JCP8522]
MKRAMQFQAQSERFAAQKQCFCFKRLSAPNCLCALRSSTKAGRRALQSRILRRGVV